MAIVAVLAVVTALLRLGGNTGSAPEARGGVAGVVGSPASTPSPTPGAAKSSVGPSASTSAAASAVPADAKATIKVTEQALRTWTDPYGEVTAEVIAVARNDGTVAATLAQGSGYSIAAADGTIVASGVFARSFPASVAPGEKAYLIDAVPATFVKPGDLRKLKLTVTARPATQTTATLTVEGLAWTTDGGAVTVTGTVRNDESTAADHVVVAAILRDANGRIVCAVYDVGSVTGLAPGQTATFKTSYPASAPAPGAAVVRAEAIAFAQPADGP